MKTVKFRVRKFRIRNKNDGKKTACKNKKPQRHDERGEETLEESSQLAYVLGYGSTKDTRWKPLKRLGK